jgi:hypothetical protein
MPNPYILLTVATLLVSIGFAIPGPFPDTFFWHIFLVLLVAGYLDQDELVLFVHSPSSLINCPGP